MNTAILQEKLDTITISGTGICCLDHIMIAPRPSLGDTVHAREYCIEGGGQAATALVACTRLGVETHIYSMLGEDANGDILLDGLLKEHVNTTGIARLPHGTSPVSLVHVDEESGDRTILHRRIEEPEYPESDFAAIAKSDLLLVDHCFPKLTTRALRVAREHGVPTLADTYPRDDNQAWLPDVDILIAPKYYLERGGFGDNLDAALEAIHAAGPETAVITLGDQGWISSDKSGRIHGEAFKVDVVDTIGAGDVFHGAFAVGVTLGWDTARCAEFASAVAALKCTAVGGRTGIPNMAQTLEFLKQYHPYNWDDYSYATCSC